MENPTGLDGASFNILSLKAGGLLSKSRRPEFEECVNKCDLIYFQ